MRARKTVLIYSTSPDAGVLGLVLETRIDVAVSLATSEVGAVALLNCVAFRCFVIDGSHESLQMISARHNVPSLVVGNSGMASLIDRVRVACIRKRGPKRKKVVPIRSPLLYR